MLFSLIHVLMFYIYTHKQTDLSQIGNDFNAGN